MASFRYLIKPELAVWVYITPIIGIAIIYGTYVYLSRNYRRRRLGSRAAVVPYRAPFGFDLAFRMLHAVVKHKFMELQQDFLRFGHVVEVQTAGSTMIFTDEPEIFKAVMSTKFSDFGKGKILHDIFVGTMGEAIFCTDGDTWRTSRSILRPHSAKSRSTDLEVTEEHFAHVLKHLQNEGQSIEVWDLVDRYQLDVITHIFFGQSAESLITNQQPFRNAMERLLKIASMKMTFGAGVTWMPDWLLAPSSVKELDSYVKSLYSLAQSSDYQKKNEEDLTLMDSLALRKLSFEEFKAQVMAIMLGGKDPPALTMTWAIWEMARHPAVYQRARAEVTSICGYTKPPTAAQLKECTYVRHIANESMRLYHPLAINMKIALEDTTLPTGGGASGKEPIAVLKDTQIVLSLWNLQRRHDLVGPDANEFRPERWEKWKPQRWEFIPFNHGNRTCIGQKFGQEQVEYLIARIAQEFDEIVIADEQVAMGYKIELNVKPLHPCLCRFIRHSNPIREKSS